MSVLCVKRASNYLRVNKSVNRVFNHHNDVANILHYNKKKS